MATIRGLLTNFSIFFWDNLSALSKNLKIKSALFIVFRSSVCPFATFRRIRRYRRPYLCADHKMLLVYKVRQPRSFAMKAIIDRSSLTAENYKPALKLLTDEINYDDSYEFNSFACSLITAIDSTANSLVKQKNISISYSKRWFNDELKELRRKRNEANKRATFMNDQTH